MSQVVVSAMSVARLTLVVLPEGVVMALVSQPLLASAPSVRDALAVGQRGALAGISSNVSGNLTDRV